MKRTSLSAGAILGALLLLASSSWAAADGKRIAILFTHDLHSYFLPHRVPAPGGQQTYEGGYARLAGLIQRERTARADRSILVDAGDFSMGTLFHTAFMKEASELALMGEMGYEAVTFGNHDFDFHPSGLADALQAARAKGKRPKSVVIANPVFGARGVEDASLMKAFMDYPIKSHAIIDRNGVRIGLFGLMGRDAASDAPFSRPVTFSDPVEAARKAVDVLRNREGAELVVCLSHSGTSADKDRSEDEILAREVPGIDVIISGHTHTVLEKPILAGKTIIVSAGCYGAYLGILEVEVLRSGGAELVSYGLSPVDSSLPEDPAIARKIADYKGIVDSEYLPAFRLSHDRVLAEITFDMEALCDAYGRNVETGLGNLIADAYRHAVRRAEGKRYQPISAVIQPLGHIRDTLLRGNITAADAFRVLSLGLGADGVPGYPLVAVYVSGEELRRILEVQTTVAPRKEDANLQVAGVRFTYNPHRVFFERITAIEVEGPDGRFAPIDLAGTYRVCMNLFMANMVDFLRTASHGLVSVVPKDRSGRPISDIREARIDANPGRPGIQELKEWAALAEYLQSFPDRNGNGVPDVPDRYRGPEGRYRAVPSWNPVSLLSGGGRITYGLMGAGAAFLLLIIAAWGILRMVRKIRAARFEA